MNPLTTPPSVVYLYIDDILQSLTIHDSTLYFVYFYYWIQMTFNLMFRTLHDGPVPFLVSK